MMLLQIELWMICLIQVTSKQTFIKILIAFKHNFITLFQQLFNSFLIQKICKNKNNLKFYLFFFVVKLS